MVESNVQKNKRIAKNTLVLYIRMLFLMCISLYTSRVVLDALGIDDYGIYNVVGGFVSLFALVSSALTGANSRFLNYEMGKGNNGKLDVVFSSLLTIQVLLAFVILILCEIIGLWYIKNRMVMPMGRLDAAIWCLHFSIFNFCMDLITVPYKASIVAHEKMKAFAYVSLFEGLAKLGVCYLIIACNFDRLTFYALLLLVVQFIVRLAYQIYCRRYFAECRFKITFDKVLLKQMFAYSGWHLLGNSAVILKKHGVNVLLNYFFGTVINAANGVANQVLNAVQGFTQNFMMALNPQITQSYAKGNYAYMMGLVCKGAKFSFFILMLIALPLILNADYIMHLWLKIVPEYAVRFVQLSLIVSLISSFSYTLMTAQNATGNVRNYQIVVGSIQLLDVPLCMFFLSCGFSPLSVYGIAFFIEICALFARLYMIPHYIKCFRSSFFVREVVVRCLIVFSLAVIFSFALSILVKNYLDLNFFIIDVVLCVFSSTLFIVLLGLEKEEKIFVLNCLRKIKR